MKKFVNWMFFCFCFMTGLFAILMGGYGNFLGPHTQMFFVIILALSIISWVKVMFSEIKEIEDIGK